MNESERTRLDELLDLITKEVAERLEARQARLHDDAPMPLTEPAPPAPEPPAPQAPPTFAEIAEPDASPTLPMPEPQAEAVHAVADEMPVPLAQAHISRWMGRLALGVLLIVVLINLPLNAQGTALARSIPSSASLVIADGLLVQESGSPDVYMYGGEAFHWITSIEAFDYFGYHWQNVHIVEAGFVNQFPKGRPIYLLLKCEGSPHIYQLDAGHKRWIIDLKTFAAEGYVWSDVKIESCFYLHRLPDGESIPPGHGTPPPPLP